MSYSQDEILAALGHVIDPDLQKDLVSLNMIQDVVIDGSKVDFTLVLTTPACPLREQLKKECIEAVQHYVDADAEVNVELSSMTTGRADDKEALPGVRNIIAVASGKGGVGKSTIAANLAVALANEGATVGLMDADVYGPSMPLMMGLKEQPKLREVDGAKKMVPLEAYGVKVISMGSLIDESQAVVWRGPMVSGALKQFVSDCDWGPLDYMIIDLPPGTGDVHLTMVQTVPITGAIMVTTPQDVALADAKKAAGMFRMGNINVPILGVVENMSYFTPDELPDKKYRIFGEGGGAKLATELKVELLAELPIDQAIRESGDSGNPLAAAHVEQFKELAGAVARQVAIRNAEGAPTEIVSII